MGIVRIEKVFYGVQDLPTCTRFYEDVGLESVRVATDESVFRTPANQFVVLRKNDDPCLPPSVGELDGIREVIWGVESEADMARVRAELEKDRSVRIDAEGTVHSADVTGYALGFMLATPTSYIVVRRPENSPGQIQRYSRDVEAYDFLCF